MTDQPSASVDPGARASVSREVGAFTVQLVSVTGFVWVMVSLGLRSWSDFAYLMREDGAIETLTAAFFFLSCAQCHLLALGFRRLTRTKVALLFRVSAFLFFVLAMEEISWGQRLLLIQTPEALSSVNVQKELNLHNIEGVMGTNEIRISLVLGVYGVLSGIIMAFAQSHLARGPRVLAFCDAARLFVVPVRFAPYFLQMLVYVLLRRQDSPLLKALPDKRLIKELVEFLFSLGCYLALSYRLRMEVCFARTHHGRFSPVAGP